MTSTDIPSEPMTDRTPSSRPSRAQPSAALTLAVLAALALLSAAPPARAERADRDKPMNVQADHMTYDDLKQLNVITGNVIITKGTIVLKADRVEVRQDPEGYQYATAYAAPGGLAYMRQKRDGVDEYIDGWGKRIDYDGKTGIMTLTGQAVVKRLQGGAKVLDEVRGNVITYDSNNEVYTATGGKGTSGTQDGRVHAILAPRTTGSTGAAGNGGASAPGAGLQLKPTPRIDNPSE